MSRRVSLSKLAGSSLFLLLATSCGKLPESSQFSEFMGHSSQNYANPTKSVAPLSFVQPELASDSEKPLIIGDIDVKYNPNSEIGRPTNKRRIPEILISRQEYLISWNKTTRNPNWAMWKLSLSDLGHLPREKQFYLDSDLANSLDDPTRAVGPDEYRGSCMDRGHQVNAADRKGSTENERATFIMSNIIPQTAYLNRGIWEHLEAYSRDIVRGQEKELYIIAGTIYDKNFGRIGPRRDIVIPSKNYKIIFVKDPSTGKIENVISVVMPNLTSAGTPPSDRATLCEDSGKSANTVASEFNFSGKKDDWMQYRTTVSDIERIADFDFSIN